MDYFCSVPRQCTNMCSITGEYLPCVGIMRFGFLLCLEMKVSTHNELMTYCNFITAGNGSSVTSRRINVCRFYRLAEKHIYDFQLLFPPCV